MRDYRQLEYDGASSRLARAAEHVGTETRAESERETVCCDDVPEQPQNGSRLLRN